ncbi:integral membrane protein [Xylaria cf. heliscus]|nr:integral membrane protein [Xylaria cf. heliscus]
MSEYGLGPAVVSIAWVFTALSAGVIAARFYVRLFVLRRITLDDSIIAVAFLFALVNSIFVTVSASWGLGRHIQFLQSKPNHVMYTVKYVYLCEFFSILSPGFGRISYGFLLLSLIPPNKNRRRFLWGIIGLQFLVDVGTVIISFSQCTPIEGFWDTTIKATCWPPYVQQYTGFVQGSICSAVDLILAIFPASLFWNLNMEWKQKASLSALMGLGVFAMVASIVKTIKLQAITETEDLTYAMAELAIWWTLEAYLVLIAVTIPTLRPIIGTGKSVSITSPNSYALNTFNHRKKVQISSANDNNRSFERLCESSVLTDVTTDNSTNNNNDCNGGLAVLKRSQVGGICSHDEQDLGISGSDSIVKNVTVSVSFGTRNTML